MSKPEFYVLCEGQNDKPILLPGIGKAGKGLAG